MWSIRAHHIRRFHKLGRSPVRGERRGEESSGDAVSVRDKRIGHRQRKLTALGDLHA